MSFFYPNESKFIEGKIDFNYPEKSINKRDISEKLNYQQRQLNISLIFIS